MKLLVLTDLHQKMSAVEWINMVIEKKKPDHVLFLGDITDMGTGEDAVEILSRINSKVYVIPGNCDPLDLPRKISDVAVDMHGKATNLDGYRLVGLGGSNITIFGTPFELEEEEISSKLEPISEKGMILMTHAPSYGILDHIPNGMSVGSPAIAKIVEKFRPAIALSGHIHEDIGAVMKDGILFVNPGPARDGYCAIITIENGVADAELLGPLD